MSDERCDYAVVDKDGIQQPCDRPAVGWRWYQNVEYDDMLGVACGLHENEGGRRMHDAEARLADALAENERLTHRLSGATMFTAELADDRDNERRTADRLRARWREAEAGREELSRQIVELVRERDALRGRLEDAQRLIASQLGECVGCNYDDGPDEFCPHHGRSYNDVIEMSSRTITEARTERDELRAEVARLRQRPSVTDWNAMVEAKAELARQVAAVREQMADLVKRIRVGPMDPATQRAIALVIEFVMRSDAAGVGGQGETTNQATTAETQR